MSRRHFKHIPLLVLMTGALAACETIPGVHLSSQVLQGRSTGLRLEPLRSTAPNDVVRAERAQPVAGQSWTSPPSTLAETQTQTRAAQAPVAAAAPVVESSTISAPAPVAAAPQTLRETATPSPVVASAQSFVGQKLTVAGLGDPGRDGLWMETPLVSSRRNARLTAPNGRSVVVTLEPIAGDAGQGSRLSIDGMRALGLPLTELVELRVGPV